MKYTLLIYDIPGTMEAMPEAERAATYEEYFAVSRNPGVVGGARLASTDTATTLRIKDGETLVTDGPFADTKEFLGGYYVIEADDLDAALAVAAEIPAARLGGCIEIRPVVEGTR